MTHWGRKGSKIVQKGNTYILNGPLGRLQSSNIKKIQILSSDFKKYARDRWDILGQRYPKVFIPLSHL